MLGEALALQIQIAVANAQRQFAFQLLQRAIAFEQDLQPAKGLALDGLAEPDSRATRSSALAATRAWNTISGGSRGISVSRSSRETASMMSAPWG